MSDQYLEKYGELGYTYDYGDEWRILITLEETLEDYNYGYPKLIDGAKTVPPKDVGGLHGYYEFLKIYNDPSHEEYKEVKTWAEEQGYREFDKEQINDSLKSIKYKKKEWDKIEKK